RMPPPGSRAHASVRGSVSAASAPVRVRPPACRSSAAQSSPSCRFRSGRSRARPARAERGGSLVVESGWGSCSRRRKLPEEVQATDQVQKNPSRNCSLFVTITIVVRCTLFGLDTGNVKHFLGGEPFHGREKIC